MNKKQYSSAIKKTPFKYTISKKIAKLMLDGNDRNEVFNKCFNDNYIEIDSVERRKEITNVVYERLLELDNRFLNELYNGDIVTSKFILAYAIAKNDSLFFDFLYEVYRDALLSDTKYISIDDFDKFFATKKETNNVVAGWGHFTLDQLAKGYRNILVESGLGVRNKKNIYVQKVMIHPDVEDHLKQINDNVFLQAMLGEE